MQESKSNGNANIIDPVASTWELGNEQINLGNFQDGIRFYTNAARMLSTNHAAAEARVSELEMELDEINTERLLFGERDEKSRAENVKLKAEFKTLINARKVAEAESTRFESMHEEALNQLDVVNNQLKETLESLNLKEQGLIEKANLLDEHESSLQKFEELNTKLQDEKNVMGIELQNLKQQVKQLENDLANINELHLHEQTLKEKHIVETDELKQQLAESIGKVEYTALLNRVQTLENEKYEIIMNADNKEKETNLEVASLKEDIKKITSLEEDNKKKKSTFTKTNSQIKKS